MGGVCVIKPDSNFSCDLPDPRVIFILVLILSSYGVIVRENMWFMLGLLVVAVISAALLHVNFKQLLKRLKRLWQILIFVSILRSIFTPSGNVLFEIWDIPLITTGGIQIGALVLFRLSLFITCGIMLTRYPSRTLIQGMIQIKMPYEIAYMVTVGVRFIPQLAEQLKDSLTALQLRGVVIGELKLRKRLSLYTYLILPVIVSSLQNAKELSMSMEMRAFRAKQERTSFYELTLQRHDIILISFIILLAILVAFIMIIM